MLIILCALILLILVLILLSFLIFRFMYVFLKKLKKIFFLIFSENQSLKKLPWRIFRDDIRIVNEEEMKSMVCVLIDFVYY